MPNVSEKKKKLLYLLKILLEKTDGDHALTLPQMLEELESLGITAERKSIYDDIETLRSVGVDIETRKNRTFQYYIGKRCFSLPELQMLAEAVRSARFLSNEQSAELVEKLERLCSSHQAASLRRRATAPEQAKGLDEAALDGAELLHRAITENRQVQFQPLEWRLSSTGKPERGPRKNGKALTVSPWKISWNKDHYDLLAYDPALKKARRFRLDGIASLELLPESREGGETAAALEGAGQSRPEEKIALEFPAEYLERVVERFGPGFTAESVGKNRLRASLRTDPGPELFAWLFAQGTEVKLAAPKKLAEQLRERAKAMAKLYKS